MHDSKGVARYVGGAVYVGALENGQRHGTGRVQYPDGAVYDGEWKHNVPHGKGTYTAAAMQANRTAAGGDDVRVPRGHDDAASVGFSRYEGEWRNGLADGKGRAVFTNGAVYDGEWKAGVPNGRGRQCDPPAAAAAMGVQGRVLYDGEWRNGKPHGHGKRQLLRDGQLREVAVLYVDGERSEVDQCIVCLEGEREYTCVPCGHTHFCEVCAQQLKYGGDGCAPCPTCGGRATDYIRTYR